MVRAEVGNDLRRTQQSPTSEGHITILGQTPRPRAIFYDCGSAASRSLRLSVELFCGVLRGQDLWAHPPKSGRVDPALRQDVLQFVDAGLRYSCVIQPERFQQRELCEAFKPRVGNLCIAQCEAL